MKFVRIIFVAAVLFALALLYTENSWADVSEDFSSGTFGDWTVVSGYWSIEPDIQADGTIGNVAKINGTDYSFGGNAQMVYNCGSDWRDYVLEADVRMDSGYDFWMAWRTSSSGQNYAQWFPGWLRATYGSPWGWGVWGYYYWPWEYGKWYHLTAELNGSSQKFYVDGQLLFEFTSDLYSQTGTVNFRTLWSNMSIDNIKITGVDGCSIEATVDADPDTLNLKSRSGANAFTVYVELPEGYDPSTIDPASVSVSTALGTATAQSSPVEVGDHDGNNVPDAMVKFDRSAIVGIVSVGDSVSLDVAGKAGVTAFKGTATIRVISK